MKKDPIELAVYIATGLFLAYLIYICFIAEPDQFLFGNVFIKTNPIDFGGFGALLSGIFAPLAFLWLILNFRQQDKNLKIAEKQLEVLLIEKENKRKVAKVVFSSDVFNNEITTFSENVINFEVPLDCDRPIVDFYSNGFEAEDPFTLLSSYSKERDYVTNSKKTISKSGIIYLSILFRFGEYESQSIVERQFKINYLDIDGFEQVQEFKAILYIPGEGGLKYYTNQSINKYNTLLIIQPQNG